MSGLFGTTAGPWIEDGRVIGPPCVVAVAMTCHFDSFGGIHDAPNYKANGKAIAQVPAMLELVRSVYTDSSDAVLAEMARKIVAELEVK